MEEKQGKKASGKGRKKHFSKKSKRSWRKHVDIKDIEDHLDEVRRQERLGGVISLKENDQLFFVDNDTSTKKEQDTGNKKSKQPKSTRSSAKVFQEPFFKPIVGRKRKIKNHKTESSDESVSDDEVPSPTKQKKQTTTVYDLWGSNDSKSKLTDVDEHFLKSTRKLPAKQPKSAYKVRGKAPAITVCHPGASYNPTLEDHQSLLKAAFEIEMVKEKEIQKIQRRLQLPPEEELAKLPTWEEEMGQGLFDDGSQTNEEDQESSECEEKEQLPLSKTRSRKTLKAKRKGTEKKQEEQIANTLRKEKSKENDVFRVKTITKQLRQATEKTKERQEKKLEKEKDASLKPQRLGKQKFEEMNIEIQLSDELSGSLRKLKPEGNLFEDRYKSLQRRNIIEPRIPIAAHRKYALKEYQKRSFKNYDLQEKLKKKTKKN